MYIGIGKLRVCQDVYVCCCTGDHQREVVSFDMDLMDCTVLACVLSAYCPFLVRPYIHVCILSPPIP